VTRSCQTCSVEFKTEDKRRKFCGVACYRVKQAREPNPGAFKPGLVPWNRGKKGLRVSPATEFKPGMTPVNKTSIGSVRIRTDKNGKPRAFVKVADPNVWRLRAVVEWESAHGPLAPGLVVHHRDRDSLNDAIDNLQALTRAEHMAEHSRELAEARYGAAS